MKMMLTSIIVLFVLSGDFLLVNLQNFPIVTSVGDLTYFMQGRQTVDALCFGDDERGPRILVYSGFDSNSRAVLMQIFPELERIVKESEGQVCYFPIVYNDSPNSLKLRINSLLCTAHTNASYVFSHYFDYPPITCNTSLSGELSLIISENEKYNIVASPHIFIGFKGGKFSEFTKKLTIGNLKNELKLKMLAIGE